MCNINVWCIEIPTSCMYCFWHKVLLCNIVYTQLLPIIIWLVHFECYLKLLCCYLIVSSGYCVFCLEYNIKSRDLDTDNIPWWYIKGKMYKLSLNNNLSFFYSSLSRVFYWIEAIKISWIARCGRYRNFKMFERYGSFIVAPVCKNWSRLRLNANSTQNVSKWEDIGRITMVFHFLQSCPTTQQSYSRKT